ncbi:DUF1643 domain-containing protein [Paenibacillus pinistramenti]|uniref:DUF1643 domain-containing protein n=1 Tax=Paenibacillus pinistramenti TaxID=1768003 RepID=UPI0011093508|nr:DUF1643 domain-containing protein [Paenibacillus pinistramenti]
MQVTRAAVKILDDGGITFVSAGDMKRYYFAQTIDEERLDKQLTILMYNPSTLSGNDKTVAYIEKVCMCHGFGSYNIINLIPQKGGNPSSISVYFDDSNLDILSRVLNQAATPVWIGWGQLIKGKSQELFPKELKDLLRNHASRLIRVKMIPDKYNGKYPVHPSYLRRKHFPVENIEFVPFDINHLESY